MKELIPIQSGSHIVAHLTEEQILANAGHYHLKYNKRNHLRRAIIKHRTSTVPLSHSGEGFQQALRNGFVWALRGVRGSGK